MTLTEALSTIEITYKLRHTGWKAFATRGPILDSNRWCVILTFEGRTYSTTYMTRMSVSGIRQSLPSKISVLSCLFTEGAGADDASFAAYEASRKTRDALTTLFGAELYNVLSSATR